MAETSTFSTVQPAQFGGTAPAAPASTVAPATPSANPTKDQVIANYNDFIKNNPDSAKGIGTTPSNVPGSSASVILAAQGNTNITNATTNPAPIKLTDDQYALASFGGYTPEQFQALTPEQRVSLQDSQTRSKQIQNEMDKSADVGKLKAELEDNQNRTYNASLAAENSQYAAASADLQKHRTEAIDTAKAQLASLNSSGGISSSDSAFLSHIGSIYDQADIQLQSQATQAKASLDAGNVKAYNDILTSTANTISAIKTNISNILAAHLETQTQMTQFNQTEEDKKATLNQNNDLKNATLFQNALQNLPQPGTLKDLNSDFSKLTPEQQKSVMGQEAFEVGTKAGMSPQAVWSGIKNAAGNAYKQQEENIKQQNANTAVQRAQVAALTAQVKLADKQAATIDAQTLGSVGSGEYLAALHNATMGGKYSKDKTASAISDLAAYAKNGDTENMKTGIVNYALSGGSAVDQRMYNTLQGLPAIVQSLDKKIAALPADQQSGFINGHITDIAAKFGQSENPQLKELATEFGHLQRNYITAVYGMRAASQNNDSIFKDLFPKGTNADDLNFSVLKGLTNTAVDTVNSQVQSRIGAENYNKIFPDGALSSGATSATSANKVITPDLVKAFFSSLK